MGGLPGATSLQAPPPALGLEAKLPGPVDISGQASDGCRWPSWLNVELVANLLQCVSGAPRSEGNSVSLAKNAACDLGSLGGGRGGGAVAPVRDNPEKERMEVKTESLRLTLSRTNRGGQRTRPL